MPKDRSGLSPELLLHGYSVGVFPMAEHRDDPEIFWVDPKRRGIMPLDGFHLSRSLGRFMRRTTWRYSLNRAFLDVVEGCADRADTWISDDIALAYHELHRLGHAHSYEVWDDRQLVGGVYGVVLGRAFFGESMFSRQSNASKVALAGCVDHLRRAGFRLFDTQFLTEHLVSLGAIEISRAQYRTRLDAALRQEADILALPVSSPADVAQRYQDARQRRTQTS